MILRGEPQRKNFITWIETYNLNVLVLLKMRFKVPFKAGAIIKDNQIMDLTNKICGGLGSGF